MSSKSQRRQKAAAEPVPAANDSAGADGASALSVVAPPEAPRAPEGVSNDVVVSGESSLVEISDEFVDVVVSLLSAEFSIDVEEPDSGPPDAPARQKVAPPPLPPQVPGVDRETLRRALGEFRLVRQIGVGAMGVVYLAEHRVIGSKVAIKLLNPKLASNPQLVSQFHDEARAVNRIGHPGIVRIFDLRFVPPSCNFMVMEYLEGSSLATMTSAPVSPRTAIPLLAQVCDALEAAHKVGVVHRDVKPDNVFLVKHGRAVKAKLLDFGAAWLHPTFAAEEGAETRRSVLGTPAFMPPEQWRGEQIDGRTDVYAMGVLAYLLATGRLPFETSGRSYQEIFRAHRDQQPIPPPLVNPKIPNAWAEVILKAMAKSPDDRFQTAAELAAALRGVIARRSAKVPKPAKRPKRQDAPPPSLVAAYTSNITADAQSVLSADREPSVTLDGGVWDAAFRACASTTAGVSEHAPNVSYSSEEPQPPPRPRRKA